MVKRASTRLAVRFSLGAGRRKEILMRPGRPWAKKKAPCFRAAGQAASTTGMAKAFGEATAHRDARRALMLQKSILVMWSIRGAQAWA